MTIGKRLFFDKVTGEVILEVQPQNGTISSVERNIATFTALSERNQDTFDVKELAFGEYAQDFAESAGYRVNPDTKKLEFTPRTDDPTTEPVYDRPLSEQIKELKEENENTRVLATETAELVMAILEGQ